MTSQSERPESKGHLRLVTHQPEPAGDGGAPPPLPRVVRILFSLALLTGAVAYGWHLVSPSPSSHGLMLGYLPPNWLMLVFLLLMYGSVLLLAIVYLLKEAVSLIEMTTKACVRGARLLDRLRRFDVK